MKNQCWKKLSQLTRWNRCSRIHVSLYYLEAETASLIYLIILFQVKVENLYWKRKMKTLPL